MARGSGVSLEIDASSLPLLPELEKHVIAGHLTGGCKRIRAYLDGKVAVAASMSATLREAAYDPQTSGGLLIALAAKDADRLLDDLAAAGVEGRPRGRTRASAALALGRARLIDPSFDAREIAAALKPGGPIARGLPRYEHRREQIRMAERVARTFDHGGVLAVEAGTGTGKSLAYLVPAIHWSRHSGERVIVSTQTINLQEQLVGVDLPLLAAHLGVPF